MCRRVIISACWRSLGLRSSSTEVRPSLNLLIHSHVWARLKHSSPKAVLNISEFVRRTVVLKFNAKLHAHTQFLLFRHLARCLKFDEAHAGTQPHSTKAGEALPKGIGLSFVPWREETQDPTFQGRVTSQLLPLAELQNQSENLLTTPCMSPSWSRRCI
jgi:hypothetical protein